MQRLRQMREAMPDLRFGNGHGNDRLRRQNDGSRDGRTPQKTQVHLLTMQA